MPPVRPAKPAARPATSPKPPQEDENLVEEEEGTYEGEETAGAADTSGDGETFTEPGEDEGYEEDDDNESYNLSEVDENARQAILKPGIWDGYIEEVQFAHSQEKGNPMWTWICVVEFEHENPQTHESETRERRLYYHTTWNNEAGLARIKRAIKRLNLDEDHGGPISLNNIRPQRDCDKIASVPARFRVRNRKYEGEFRNNVVDILPPGEVENDPAI